MSEASAERLVVVDPAHRGRVVGDVAVADRLAVDEAVRRADGAQPEWAALGARARGELLANAVARLADGIEARAQTLTREMGKTLWESQLDVAAAPYLLHVASRLADRVAEEERVEASRGTFIRRRVPVGVVAVIVPWNSPVVLAFNAIAPALVAGNTVVAKPSELAPLAVTESLERLAGALPAGVINVCNGAAETGASLAEHPHVRRVVLTGGPQAGQAAMRAAATHLADVTLELGGNDPAIVLDSARIDDELVLALRDAAFTCAGQLCFAVKRVYAHRSVIGELTERLREAVDEIVVGDGLDPASTMGPLIDDRAVARVEELVRRAVSDGGEVHILGAPLDLRAFEGGSFMLPHLVTGLANEAELVAVEQFGPVLPILAFENETEAIAMANDSDYGLSASVWTADVEHAFEVARRIEAGTVFVNVHRAGASDHHTPYGGVKSSGIGRVNGWATVEELTETQMLIHRTDAAQLPARPPGPARAARS